MAKNDGQIVIKKYANRRLYNTGTSTYVTLDDLAVMVKKGEEFTVQDAKTGEDITHSVLTQIIFEQESKTGNTLLPISFLRQLISYYGDQMQMVVPSYLEHSMQAFGEQQSQMREQITRAFGDNPLAKNFQLPIQMVEEQVRRNTEMFQQAMQMFAPFGAPAAPRETKKAEAKDIDELKEQLRALQTKLEIFELLRNIQQDRTMISLAQAKTMIDTAFHEAENQKMKPLAAIVMNVAADVIAFERQDNSEVLRFEMAYGKGVSALATGRNSRFMHEKYAANSHIVKLVDQKTNGRFMAFPGAILIKTTEGAIVGVMAVTGDTSENDEAVAIAGITAAGFVASAE